IRDDLVTGVQTCALPISSGGERPRVDDCDRGRPAEWPLRSADRRTGGADHRGGAVSTLTAPTRGDGGFADRRSRSPSLRGRPSEIGRASCRERGAIGGGG